MKTVLITGVSTGIGKACVQYLTRQGYFVFGSVRHLSDANSLQSECGPLFTPLVFDVTNKPAVMDAANQVKAVLGDKTNLYGLVNNAGIAVGGPLLLLSQDELKHQFDVNIHGLMNVTRHFTPLLKSVHGKDTPGRIINIGSVSGRRAIPFTGPYVASKHALEGLNDVLRMELMLYGIDVILVEPGPVQSTIWDKTPDPEDNVFLGTDYETSLRQFFKMLMARKDSGMPADVIARLIHQILESAKPRTRYLVTQSKLKNYYLPKFLPTRWVDRMIARHLKIIKK